MDYEKFYFPLLDGGNGSDDDPADVSDDGSNDETESGAGGEGDQDDSEGRDDE